MLQRILGILSLVCGLVSAAQAGQIAASVEPRQVAYGDSVRFELSYEGDDAGTMQPNLAVLSKDFAIHSTSSSMQSSFVNGVGHQKRVWSLLLMPKYEGKLTIPSITAGAYQTVPLEVEVLPAGTAVNLPNTGTNTVSGGQNQGNTQNSQPENASSSNTSGSFWAELAVDNKNPFIHQEITATLVIYDQKGVELQMPTFEANQDWLIEMVGNPEITEKNGQRIIKIIYSMIPQKDGNLFVPSARIEGTYIDFSSTPVTNSSSVLTCRLRSRK